MGLYLKVGLLSWQKKNGGIDDETAEYFEELYCFLAKNGYSGFRENEECDDCGYSMYGYSGLHYLRRIAAHLNLSNTEPAPGMTDGVDPSEDPLLRQYLELVKSGAEEPKRSFDHLIMHSDASGFYVPVDFVDVLTDSTKKAVMGQFVGSSFRLLEECKVLSDFLQLPLNLNPNDKEVLDALEYQGSGEMRWQRYGVESFTCIRLLRAAEHSIETGTAIVFC